VRIHPIPGGVKSHMDASSNLPNEASVPPPCRQWHQQSRCSSSCSKRGNGSEVCLVEWLTRTRVGDGTNPVMASSSLPQAVCYTRVNPSGQSCQEKEKKHFEIHCPRAEEQILQLVHSVICWNTRTTEKPPCQHILPLPQASSGYYHPLCQRLKGRTICQFLQFDTQTFQILRARLPLRMLEKQLLFGTLASSPGDECNIPIV
jgi:hypothetical protein